MVQITCQTIYCQYSILSSTMQVPCQYKNLLKFILTEGKLREDRTGVNTYSVFGETLYFDLSSFPLLTDREIPFRIVFHELMFFLRGETTTKYLNENNVKIWDPWAKNGKLGPIYGKQWRDWNGIDQVSNLMEGLKNNPHSRRHIISAWNVSDLDKMALPPCHYAIQAYVDGNKLSLMVNMRSSDVVVGLPFNIAEYALLTYMIAATLNLEPDELIMVLGDTHIYTNHVEAAHAMIKREWRQFPKLRVNRKESLTDYTFEDFTLVGYNPHEKIKLTVAV